MRQRPASPGWVAVALPLLVLRPGPAAGQDLIKKSYLSAALAYEALTTAVETCAKQGQQMAKTATIMIPGFTTLSRVANR